MLTPRTPCLTAFALLLVQTACTGQGKPGEDDSQDTAGAEDDSGGDADAAAAQLAELGVRNVIVVHADTLRSDHLPMYGYDRMTAPNLAEAGGMVIWGYEASASWTLPSTTSALLGLTPEHHGNVIVRGGSGAAAATSISEHLQANGFATAAFSGSRVIATDPELAEGFDVALDVEDLDDVEAQSMGALWDGAEAWLDGLGEDEPFFLWFQPMDTHPPYRPTAPFRGTWADYDVVPMNLSDSSGEQLLSYIAAWDAAYSTEDRQRVVDSVRDVYDELILQEDDGIGKIFDWLDANGHRDDTLVVLSSDHGETLSDDLLPSISHGTSLRPELLRVPMVLYNPALTERGRACLSSNVDLAPTLIRALGLDPIPGLDGQPIQDACRPMVFASLYDEDGTGPGGNRLWALSVTDGTYKLDWDCLTGVASFYDLPRDPSALDPLKLDQAPAGDLLWQALTEYLSEAAATNPGLSCEIDTVAGSSTTRR